MDTAVNHAPPSPEVVLTPRWTPLRPHPIQRAYWHSPHRFNMVPAGRRSGKTELAKRKLVKRALGAKTLLAPAFFAAAPTRDQAKAIYWEDLKALVPKRFLRARPSESHLMIPLINGADIWVLGMDKPERVEGRPWDGGILDEFGNMKEKAWASNVRPALADRNGWCDLIGVPEGRNHYYDLNNRAKAAFKAKGRESEWCSFTWPSKDILSPEEIAALLEDLDPLTADQELNASFINFEGRAYYVFNEDIHCTGALKYNPKAPLILMFDFNVEPGVAAIAQEQELPGQMEMGRNPRTGLPDPNMERVKVIGTGIIGEVHIPRNSNTPAVCRAILSKKDGTPSKWAQHQGPVWCYGDATGGSRGSAKVEGSDWELIEAELRPVFKNRLDIRVGDSNPKERARINAVNSRLQGTTGVIRMMVDGAACLNVVKDFEGVTLLKGGSGEIDKKKSPQLTHISDAIGYYVEKEFPVASRQVQKVTIGGV